MAATLCENVNGQLKPVGGQFIEPFSYSYTPIGSIVPILGTTVPDGYLICDGSSYNIDDYQELAAYFVDQFGSVNYFGGNGLTTFAIPNITGAPSDVLSCIAVKNLYFANTGVTPSDSFVLRSQILTFNNNNVATINAPNVTSDTFFFVFYHDSSRSAAQDADITVRSGSGELIFTAENAPSGSIVCDVMCTNFEHQSGGSELPILFDERGIEKHVGWYVYENGTRKPVYEKTFKISPRQATWSGQYSASISVTPTECGLTYSDIDILVGGFCLTNGWQTANGKYGSHSCAVVKDANSENIIFILVDSGMVWACCIRYTKTTDTPV